MPSGQALIDQCKRHLLDTMATLPECAADGPGLGNKAIEDAAGFALHLSGDDGYFTWSLLIALSMDGKVDIVPPPGKRGQKYRLVAG